MAHKWQDITNTKEGNGTTSFYKRWRKCLTCNKEQSYDSCWHGVGMKASYSWQPKAGRCKKD